MKRPVPIPPALLGFALLLITSVGLSLGMAAKNGAAPEQVARAVPLAVDKALGVNVDLSRYGPAAMDQALESIRAAGLRWVRQRFPWDVIEPQPGSFDWVAWDAIVDGVARHGLGLIAVVDGAPAWARSAEDGDNRLAPPVEPRDFGRFVAAFAARYRAEIDYYQIWDEPNIAPHWGAGWVDPASYASLLREGAIQARAADPSAVILAAALAPNVEPGGENMADTAFLSALYDLGAEEWFDVVAVQPYGFGAPVGDPPRADALNWRRIELVHQVMERYGDAETAIWAVAFGWRENSVVQAVMPDQQGIGTLLANARTDWPWLGPMLWAAWDPVDAHGDFALLGVEGGSALRELERWASEPPVAWPGVYRPDHASGTYAGSWRVTADGADVGGSGDRLTIRFRGTRLYLAIRRGAYQAFFFVTVDGRPSRTLPRDGEGRSYLVLYDPLHQAEMVDLTGDLARGPHQVEIVAERGWGQWVVSGWAVTSRVPREAGWQGWALAATIAAIAAGGLAWALRADVFRLFGQLWAAGASLDWRIAIGLAAALALGLYIAEGTGFTLVLAVLLAAVLAVRPDAGLPLIAAALPFYQPGVPLLGKLFSLVEILSLLTFAGWAVRAVLRSGPVPGRVRGLLQWSSLDWAVAALVGIGAVSLVWTEHVREAAREWRTVLLEAGIYYGLLRAMVRDQRGVWRVLGGWTAGGVTVAAIGLAQWALGQDVISAEGVGRVRAFYGSPNNLALYLGRLLPVGVAIAAWGGPTRRRVLFGLITVVAAGAIALTYSRGAWLLGVPAALLFLAALRGRRTLLTVGACLLAAGLLLGMLVGAERLTSLTDLREGTTFFRLQLWRSSLVMGRDHPLTGVGLDNFLYQYRTRYVVPDAWEEFNLSHPHNLVLDVWLRLGVPGLAVFGWLLAAFFRTGRRVLKGAPTSSSDWVLAAGLMAGMVDLVAHGLVDNAFFLVDLAFVFLLMLWMVQAVPSCEGSPGTVAKPTGPMSGQEEQSCAFS